MALQPWAFRARFAEPLPASEEEQVGGTSISQSLVCDRCGLAVSALEAIVASNPLAGVLPAHAAPPVLLCPDCDAIRRTDPAEAAALAERPWNARWSAIAAEAAMPLVAGLFLAGTMALLWYLGRGVK